MERLGAKLAKAKPATSSERALRDTLRRSADKLATDNEASEPDFALFKYRQVREPWRLVWCWGYQRADTQPAPAVICTNPDCQELFLRRPGSDGRCPGCADVVAHKVAKARRGSRIMLAALLLLLALLAGVYIAGQPRLVVTPANWEGPIGSRVAFRVVDRSWFWHEEDVTARTTPLAHDTRIIRFEPHDCVAFAPGAGSTRVSFHYGDLSTDVPVVAVPADGLTGFCISPAVVDLASGSTAELKALAKDSTGREHDLTATVNWQSQDPQVALARPGLVEGAGEGETIVEVSYTPKAGERPLLAQAAVSVKKVDFSSLSLKLAPSELTVGQRARVEVFADTDLARYSFYGSSQLALSVDPPSIAKIEDDGAVALAPGKAQIQATVGRSRPRRRWWSAHRRVRPNWSSSRSKPNSPSANA